MKKLCYIILLILSLNTVAQTDTIVITKTDTVFVQEKQDLMYKFFVENRVKETNHLWKLSFIDLALVKPNVGYEHRLGRSWSVEGFASAGNIGNVELEFEGSGIVPQLMDISAFVMEIEQQFKYYYNLTRRKKLGKRADGFRGNYLASSFWYKYSTRPSTNDYHSYSEHLSRGYQYNAGIKYGLQRRIGNIGYLDFYVGAYYRWQSIKGFSFEDGEYFTIKDNRVVISVGVKAGFAMDSFENLKRTTKD